MPIEIDEGNSIKEVKETIEKTHDIPAGDLKLIAFGKILANDA